MKARDVSLWVKIAAVVVVIILMVLKGLGIITLEEWGIWGTGILMVAMFSDVSLNLLIEKITGKLPGPPNPGA